MRNRQLTDIDPFQVAMHKLLEQKEQYILAQLKELVSRGILVLEDHGQQIIKHAATDELELVQTLKLVVKDQDYILKLEKENKALHARLDAISEALTSK